MSEETNKQEVPEQLSDILLVLDKEKKKIQAVQQMDENGKMKMINPTKRNQNLFMRVDRHGDFISNFFSNFISQLKDPTKFSFFKVTEPMSLDLAKALQKEVNHPTSEGKELMDKHELKTEQKNQKDMATTETTTEQNQYRCTAEQIDWETVKNLGLSKEYLEKRNLLEPLLKGYKTNELVGISARIDGISRPLRVEGRLSLIPREDGKFVPDLYPTKKQPNLYSEFFGHKFTDEDKKNLLETGNMGRVVDLKNTKTGELIPSIISIDKLTNDVIALRTDFIKIPDEIKGVKLDDAQKQILMEGKPLFIKGMTSTKGTPFDANVQYNADKRYVEFLFDRNQNNSQTQSKQQSQPEEAPKTFRGKKLDNEQQDKLKEGQSVYVELTDKKGQPYQGYITLNKATGKPFFEFPSQYKERVQATEAHKTQTEVNSKGKTNEATKNLKEPLQKGQQRPKNEKQQEKQDKPKAPAKSRGKKVS
ncbi:DUF3945 domain-containing protein [Flavobacterium dauae]|uniref:DUF3945 domain-containing protein n=1 Tax=Flavobacterium dauae TaxID=1563479 RepID=UPI00101B383A|nr:DUF3945 domain-containing protein [Flavobacterium dauae]WLD23317.1 DUF3945 domain-containing protein [Flavobacterium dauae]